jgi:hypothetical protein
MASMTICIAPALGTAYPQHHLPALVLTLNNYNVIWRELDITKRQGISKKAPKLNMSFGAVHRSPILTRIHLISD